MSVFWEKFQWLCRKNGISTNRAVEELHFSSGVLTHWKNGVVPRNSTIKKIAEYFDVPVSFFAFDALPTNIYQDMNEEHPKAESYPIQGLCVMPVVGTVRAGYGSGPMIDYEDEYVSIPTEQFNGYKASECRLIRVKGDSMYPRVMEGDLIIVHIQPEVESGDTAVVFNGDDEATLKKIRILPDHIEMIPSNSKYETRIIAGNDLSECRIYGKVLSLIRTF